MREPVLDMNSDCGSNVKTGLPPLGYGDIEGCMPLRRGDGRRNEVIVSGIQQNHPAELRPGHTFAPVAW
jgi:hypothetical protein